MTDIRDPGSKTDQTRDLSAPRAAQNYPSDPRRRVAIILFATFAVLHFDRDHPALAPGLQDQPFDLFLARPILALPALFRSQIEAFEVAEAVVAHADDLAGGFAAALMALLMARMGSWANLAGEAVKRRRDLVGIAAQAVHPCAHQLDVTFPHRPPAIGRRVVSEPPLENGQRVLFQGQHDLGIGDPDAHVERTADLAPVEALRRFPHCRHWPSFISIWNECREGMV